MELLIYFGCAFSGLVMEQTIYKIIEIYKKKRDQHLEKIYKEKEWSVWHAFRNRIKPSEESFIEKELTFQSELSADIGIEHALKNLRGEPLDWVRALLLLKNKSERLGFQIDYLNYFHTFLAFVFAILVLLADKVKPNNWILAVLTGVFICKVFVDRSNLRRELVIYKEVINLIEANKENLK